ncbi:MAG: hypothetical protein M3P91_12000 [Actinomycetota bacterium]|nr:hypothetical protein [Actinomycetota bacterium]
MPGEKAPLGGIGGMMGLGGRPSSWLVYFAVADVAAAVAAAERAGGAVIMREIDTPFGPMAGLMDPAGAVFWVVRTRGNDPDRSG